MTPTGRGSSRTSRMRSSSSSGRRRAPGRLPQPRATVRLAHAGGIAARSSWISNLTRRGPRPRVRHRHSRRDGRDRGTARRRSPSARREPSGCSPTPTSCWRELGAVARGHRRARGRHGPGKLHGHEARARARARLRAGARRARRRRLDARRAGGRRTRLAAGDRRRPARGLHDDRAGSRARCRRRSSTSTA